MTEPFETVSGAAVPAKDRLMVALDCPVDEALDLARSLAGHVRWLKVGMTLFYERGPEVVKRLVGDGFDVFLDLKLHDIPHQVEGAALRVATLGAKMLTVHAAGGAGMLEAALAGAREGAEQVGEPPPAVIAVTVLTSLSEADLSAVGVTSPAPVQVERLAILARDAGLAGVVCSPHEAAIVREVLGASALVVTPGVRPAGFDTQDQSRVATPASAIRAGASHIVVGRPITGARAPVDVVQRIISEMEGES